MTTLDPELWFHERAAFYGEAQVLYHLNESGVFLRLAEDGGTTEEIAASLGLVEGGLQSLLEFVEGVDDLIARDGQGRWSRSERGRRVLDRFGRMDPDGLRLILDPQQSSTSEIL